MGEVRLPLLRDAHVRHAQTTHSTANMVAQRVLALQQVDGSEDSAQIGHRVAENGPKTDDGRLAAVERRLEAAERDRQQSDARMADMMSAMMNMLNAVRSQTAPDATKVKSAADLGAPGRAANLYMTRHDMT